MSGVTQDTDPARVETQSPRKLKILMLHGYAQSDHLFHNKTRSLEKKLTRAFPASVASPLHAPYPGGVQLFYPKGPYKLRPADIPGLDASRTATLASTDLDAWGWWRRDPGGGRYLGMEEGLRTIAAAIREAGGVDGVIGFSQGGAAAAMVASLLGRGRRESFARYKEEVPEALGFPEEWVGLQDFSLRFAVAYCGFKAPSELYGAFYRPLIDTPILLVLGSLDTVVDERWSKALAEACEEASRYMMYHPGGHFVPTGKDMMDVLSGFVKDCCMRMKMSLQ